MELFRKAVDLAAMEEVPETRSRGQITGLETHGRNDFRPHSRFTTPLRVF